tara:strand:+ start:4617 stop:5534 length:918 start_codon:yes stop_codon:yes gene_type:complete
MRSVSTAIANAKAASPDVAKIVSISKRMAHTAAHAATPAHKTPAARRGDVSANALRLPPQPAKTLAPTPPTIHPIVVSVTKPVSPAKSASQEHVNVLQGCSCVMVGVSIHRSTPSTVARVAMPVKQALSVHLEPVFSPAPSPLQQPVMAAVSTPIKTPYIAGHVATAAETIKSANQGNVPVPPNKQSAQENVSTQMSTLHTVEAAVSSVKKARSVQVESAFSVVHRAHRRHVMAAVSIHRATQHIVEPVVRPVRRDNDATKESASARQAEKIAMAFVSTHHHTDFTVVPVKKPAPTTNSVTKGHV